jgi:LPXTG-motif cell wall-anchored protein
MMKRGLNLKALKHVSILLSFMLLFFISLPVTGAFAAGNAENQAVKNGKESSQVDSKENNNQVQKEASKPKDENENTANSNNDNTEKSSAVKKEAVQGQKEDSKENSETKDDVAKTVKSASDEKDTKTKVEESVSEKIVNTNKSTQIHLHLKDCVNPTVSVFVELKGEWKEMSNPGSSPLFKLLDSGEFVKDDVTAFKLVFEDGEELVVPVSEIKVGVEAEGTINYWLENCDLPENGETAPDKDANKSTQIHLHLKNCTSPAATVFVELKGEWKEMTNPGKSPLYKLLDGGEFVKEDITAFKIVFTSGGELVVPVSDLKVGVEAEGSINYWLENCDIPQKNTFKTLSLSVDDSKGKIDSAAVIMMNGKRIEFKLVNHVWTIYLTEETKVEMLRELELTSNGQTMVIPLTQLSDELVQLEGEVLTLQVNWSMQGELVGEETNESAAPAPVKHSDSGNTPGGSAGSNGWVGGDVLPQTGEGSRMPYYILGLLIAAGGVMLRFRSPLKN